MFYYYCFLIGTGLFLCQSKRRSDAFQWHASPVRVEGWYVKTKCGADVLVSIAVSGGSFRSGQHTHRTAQPSEYV